MARLITQQTLAPLREFIENELDQGRLPARKTISHQANTKSGEWLFQCAITGIARAANDATTVIRGSWILLSWIDSIGSEIESRVVWDECYADVHRATVAYEDVRMGVPFELEPFVTQPDYVSTTVKRATPAKDPKQKPKLHKKPLKHQPKLGFGEIH